MVAAAKTAAALQTKVGTRKQQDRIRAAATAAQSNATQFITQARKSDLRVAHEARAAVELLRVDHQAIADEATALAAELQLRTDHPDPAADYARLQGYEAEQALAAAQEVDAADTYGTDPHACDPRTRSNRCTRRWLRALIHGNTRRRAKPSRQPCLIRRESGCVSRRFLIVLPRMQRHRRRMCAVASVTIAAAEQPQPRAVAPPHPSSWTMALSVVDQRQVADANSHSNTYTYTLAKQVAGTRKPVVIDKAYRCRYHTEGLREYVNQNSTKEQDEQ